MFSKYISCILILVALNGCGTIPQNNLVFEKKEAIQYEELVNSIDEKSKKCFNKEYTFVDTYVVRENYETPLYTKFILYIDNQIPDYIKELGAITVFKQDKMSEIYINQSVTGFRDIKSWYLNKMECLNED